MDKKRKLIQSMLEEGDYAQWKEEIRKACLSQAANERDGAKKLINHLLMDGDYLLFRKRLKKSCVNELGINKAWRKSMALLGAAIVLGALLFLGHQFKTEPMESRRPSSLLVATKPLAPWQIANQKQSLCVVKTDPSRMKAIELRTKRFRNVVSSSASKVPIQTITDSELLAMFKGFTCGFVRTGDNNKKFFLFKKDHKLRFY